MTRRAERGFTLIELMVALVVSSLLVGMILAIFTRMSLAYRGQQQIAGVQQVLGAARAAIELDAKQAGLEMSQGFKIASVATIQSPVRVINNAAGTGPDQIAFFYADTSTSGMLANVASWTNSASITTYEPVVGLVPGDLAVLVTVDTSTPIGGAANIATYNACVLRVTAIAATSISFSTAAPWGTINESHCGWVPQPLVGTMVYKLIAHGYRIDTSSPARAALGPLQLSPTGGLLGDPVADGWADLAFGFTDLQTALQAYDGNADPSDTPDPDSDGNREWYSSDLQTTLTAPGSTMLTLPGDGLLQVSISLVARTDRDVEGIATASTPLLTVVGNTANNTIGDRPAFALPSATDDALKGARIYRYTSFQVDFRNLGVGR